MAILIDGYNLLNAVGIEGRRSGQGSLEAARAGLLDWLAEHLSEDQRGQTTVVFDAREAPPGLPRELAWRGITVRFAPRGQDADTLLEELIREDRAPRRSTVVSSDHRVQRAARRRRARAVDSDVWFAEVARCGPPQAAEPASDEPALDRASPEQDNPFPPGYGEDLLREEFGPDAHNPFPPGYGDEALGERD